MPLSVRPYATSGFALVSIANFLFIESGEYSMRNGKAGASKQKASKALKMKRAQSYENIQMRPYGA